MLGTIFALPHASSPGDRKDIGCGYIPLEVFMSPGELAWGRAKIVPSIKDWLSYNLDVFEKKSSGRLFS